MTTQEFSFPADVPRLLASGAAQPANGNPSSPPDEPLQVLAAYQQKGRARPQHLPPEVAGTPAGRLLQRYGRLLALEEAAMEQDICRQEAAPSRLAACRVVALV